MAEQQDSDGLVERVEEALYNLSDSVRACGMLINDRDHARYEAVVETWSALRPTIEAMSRELVEKHEALTQMHEIARKALEGSASDRAV